MAKLPTFVFPKRELQDSAVFSSLHPLAIRGGHPDDNLSSIANGERPKLLVRTRSREGQGVARSRPSVPEVFWTRPQVIDTHSTPPDSPIRARAFTMGAFAMGADSNIQKGDFEATPMSPPLTPTQPRHASSNSDVSLRTLTKAPPSQMDTFRHTMKEESYDTLAFPYWETDYEILTVGPKAIKKVLGSGVWSDVYHALPTPPNSNLSAQIDISRPVTPRSRSSSASTASYFNQPLEYAIKTPSSAAARTVLAQEARVLSYLTRLPRAPQFIVPFYGQDTRSDALVLKLMDGTLESWITNSLNVLPEPERAANLAVAFPHIARQLLLSLEWLKSHNCTHADIKPGNILVSTTTTTTTTITTTATDPESNSLPASAPQTLLTDFSSAILPTVSPSPSSSSSEPNAPPLGGGTWDFLSPTSLHPSTRHLPPTPAADLWATAMTLLVLAVGASPYAFVGANVFQRRELIKMGNPVEYVGYGDSGARNVARLKGLGRVLGVDLVRWFRRVLAKEGAVVVEGPGEWLAELDGGIKGQL